MFDKLSALKLSNGDNEIRTRDPLLARQVLSQLSYTPIVTSNVTLVIYLVGLNGLEPSTSRLSGVRSNQLSYRPFLKKAGEENRTPDISLEGWGFTTKLHPHGGSDGI